MEKKFKVWKELKFFGVSEFSFWAIELILKDVNDKKKLENLILVADKWLGCYF